MKQPETREARALLALAERGQRWAEEFGADDDARAAMYATEVMESLRRNDRWED